MLIDNIAGSEFRYEIYICKPYATLQGTTPVHQTLGCLTECADEITYKKELQNVNELTFNVYLNWNDLEDTENTNFNLVKEGKIILLQTYIDDTLQSSEYLYIYEVNLEGGEKSVKSVKCYSKQYLWNKIKLRDFQDNDDTDFVATRRIYTGDTFDATTPTLGGIIDYIIQEKLYNTWSVSYVSASISDVYRTFDITEQSLLDVVHDVERLFNCVFFFDTYHHDIQIKAYADLDSETGLVLAKENYLTSIKENIKLDEVVTRLYCTGKDGITLNGVNVTGQGYIDNFTYFRTTDYMSSGLIAAFLVYDDVLVVYQGQFEAQQEDLTEAQEDMDILEVELANLETLLIEYTDNQDACVRFGGLILGHDYSYWHNLVTSTKTSITNKNLEIDAKQIEIDNINIAISAIATATSYEANFTTTQLQELVQFINEETVTCDTDDEDELMNYAEEVLAIKASPPIEFDCDVADFLSASSENFTWDKFTLGALIDLEYDDFNIQSKPRITSYTHNISNHTLSVTVSNKTYLNDDLNYISAIIAMTRKTTALVSEERTDYLSYTEDRDTIIYNSDTIDTTITPIESGNGTVLTRYGMFFRETENANSQLRIFDDRILFTNDNWATEPTTAINSEGIYCQSLWMLTNTGGTVTINDSTIQITDMELDLLANSNNNRILLNPLYGFQIQQSTTPVLYCDTDGTVYAKDIHLQANGSNNVIYINPDKGIEITKTGATTPLLYATAGGDLYLQNAYFVNSDGSISISPTKIEILNGAIEIKNSAGTSTILDEYGIDPKFLDYYKNMVINSSFECFDDVTKIPTFWSAGESYTGSAFHGTYSLKLTAGETSIQTAPSWAAGVVLNPEWWDSLVARVSFYRKLGEVTIKIKDITNSTYYTLTDEEGNTGTSIVFATNTSWVESRSSITFDPNETGHETCVNCAVEFTNSHATDSCYIDAVQLAPDFTGKWSQIYKDGQYSVGVNSIGDYSPTVATFG